MATRPWTGVLIYCSSLDTGMMYLLLQDLQWFIHSRLTLIMSCPRQFSEPFLEVSRLVDWSINRTGDLNNKVNTYIFLVQICAGGEEGKDSCSGDSGGPLITTGIHGPPYQLVGLTSFGSKSCGIEGRYGVYTAVADFRPWIVQNLKN